MDQPGQIINEDTITPPGVSSAVQLPPSKPKGLIIIFFVILVLILAGGLVYAGMQIGKKQSQVAVLPTPVPTSFPTEVVVPTENPTVILSTPTINLTTNWKIYKNDFAGIGFEYPPGFSYKEEILSINERRISFGGSQGILNLNVASLEYSPGWGGGCDASKQKEITFLGKPQKFCMDDINIWAFYHVGRKSQMSITATVNPPYKENMEVVLQILSTFKFLE